MSWSVGTVKDPDGIVHMYCQTIGTFEDDMIVCKAGTEHGFMPIPSLDPEVGWRYCVARVTCEACKGNKP